MSRFHYGINLAAFNRGFLDLGGTIISVNGTGEHRYIHPILPRRPRVNARRKDAPRDLVRFGLQVERILEQPVANDDRY